MNLPSPAFYSSELMQAPIFVVDDEPVNLKLVERILGNEGFRTVHSIQHPEQVVEHYRQVRPHLILLDINMPHLDGFGVLQALKQHSDTPLPPVAFLTAQNASEYRVKAFDNGVLDFISKPFNRLELIARVKNLLALEHAHQALEHRKNDLEAMVQQRTEALRKTQLLVMQKLGRAAEYRDHETGAHILRMSHTAALLARELGCGDNDVQQILHASPLHDVGKIAIPDHILLKQGRFTAEEWAIMQSHTTLGYQILQAEESELLTLAGEIALHHHEKWDGSGYPHQLAGERIPLSCRIVAAADVFDALLSQRPYKQPWELDQALAYMNAQTAKQFDPAIMTAFNRRIDDIVAIRAQYQDPAPNTAAPADTVS
ncbi:MAG TPA: HD domain-containing phosphohydrolase [Hyphomicrobiales bacterium]|nr:HD domain-containing phosphohydrolase [Hyphomicrobiales bacterium]